MPAEVKSCHLQDRNGSIVKRAETGQARQGDCDIKFVSLGVGKDGHDRMAKRGLLEVLLIQTWLIQTFSEGLGSRFFVLYPDVALHNCKKKNWSISANSLAK
jgi:hypothetical protein